MINVYLQCSHYKAVNNGKQVIGRDQKYCNLTIFLHNLGLKYPMAEDIMPWRSEFIRQEGFERMLTLHFFKGG